MTKAVPDIEKAIAEKDFETIRKWITHRYVRLSGCEKGPLDAYHVELSRLQAQLKIALGFILEQECECDGDYDSHAERYRGQCERCKVIDDMSSLAALDAEGEGK